MENHIKVDLEGDLYFQGKRLTHDKIIDFFKRLDMEKIDEKLFQLKWQNNGITQRINVIAEDTVYVIKDVIKENNEIKIVLNDETLERLETVTLEFQGNIPYVMVKRGKVKARFNRHAAFKLGEAILGS